MTHPTDPISNIKKHPSYFVSFLAFLILAGGIWYVGYLNQKNAANIDRVSSNLYSLELSIASTTAILQTSIAQTHSDLSNSLTQQQQLVQNQIVGYQQQVTNVAGTVTNLQKLAATDPQLLQKYSKVYFLNENYNPVNLMAIPAQYGYNDTKTYQIQSQIWPHMQQMLNDANAAHINLYVFSAYRSFGEQSALKKDYRVTYGAGTANSFSADQGYSEHQLGTAADFITSGLGGVLDGFDQTPAYTWMQANAYKYGFSLSYPANNSYYTFEPWHWRYVGVKLATDLHNANQNFADWDQRKIDDYLINFFD